MSDKLPPFTMYSIFIIFAFSLTQKPMFNHARVPELFACDTCYPEVHKLKVFCLLALGIFRVYTDLCRQQT